MRARSAAAISSTRESKRSRSSRSACSSAARHASTVSASETSAVNATIRVRAAGLISHALLPARAALHLTPAAAGAGDPLPETLQAPQRDQLPVAEVLDQRGGREREQLGGPLV